MGRKASRRTAISFSAPRPELKNFYVGAGFNAFGIASGRRRGLGARRNGSRPAKRRWICGSSTSAASPISTRTATWVCDRTLEAYGKHYTIGFPHEEYESGRPRIVSPLYERLKELQCLFRLEARLGAAELVRAEGCRAERRLFDGPAELVRRGRRGASRRARAGRHVRPVVLRQI